MTTKSYSPDKLYAVMQASALLRGLTVSDLLGDSSPERARVTVQVFSSGEEIPWTRDGERLLTLILEGQGIVTPRGDDRFVMLKTALPSDVFGVSILFSIEPPVSTVRAKGQLVALCLPASAIRDLLDRNADFRMRYITFLSGRICFLNQKIAAFTAGSVERRLARYLASIAKEEDGGTLHLPIPMTALAAQLDVSRASLYRALDRLVEEGLIERDGRALRVSDKAALSAY